MAGNHPSLGRASRDEGIRGVPWCRPEWFEKACSWEVCLGITSFRGEHRSITPESLLNSLAPGVEIPTDRKKISPGRSLFFGEERR